MADSDSPNQNAAAPNPALQRLNRLVGTWSMKGRPVGSNEDSISGTTTFKWLQKESVGGDTGFFLEQDMEMNYAGKEIRSHELIGYNPKTKAFSSNVYSNMAPDPWPYEWDVHGNDWTISINHGPMNAAFVAKFSPDGNSFAGGWRPTPGADEKINTPYDVRGTRIK